MAEGIGRQMIASYTISITGIQRTRRELAALDNEIALLRKTSYSPSTGISVTAAGSAGSKDIFVSRFDDIVGRVQGRTRDVMAQGMALGKRTQAAALRAATTKTGLSGLPAGRKGPGREVTGGMIGRIATNVETFKTGDFTQVTGWHGWGADSRSNETFQEKGTRGRSGVSKKARSLAAKSNTGHPGVPPANSLGATIPKVREFLKKNLGGVK